MTAQTRIDLRVPIPIESNTVNIRISIRGRPHDSSKIRHVVAVFLPRRPFTCSSTLCSCSFA